MPIPRGACQRRQPATEHPAAPRAPRPASPSLPRPAPVPYRQRAGDGDRVCEAPAPATVYRPRHPERTAYYQILEAHRDEYCRTYEERFEPVD